MFRLFLILSLFLVPMFAFASDAAEVVAPPEGIEMNLLIPALVALGAALVRAAIIIVKPNAAKLGTVGTVILLVLSVAAGFLDVLAAGGSLIEAITVALAVLAGGVGGGFAQKIPIVKERAERISDGSIKLNR